MGIEIELPSVQVKAENRTWRVQIECGFDRAVADRTVEFLREVVTLDADGNRLGAITQHATKVGTNEHFRLHVSANFAALGGRTFTAGGATVTGAQMMALISLIGDTLWQEAVAAELARQAAASSLPEPDPEPEPEPEPL